MVKKLKRQNESTKMLLKIRHKEYIDVAFKKMIRHKMKRIQNKLHRIGTYYDSKISFSCFDDKRYILDDGLFSQRYKKSIKLGQSQ